MHELFNELLLYNLTLLPISEDLLFQENNDLDVELSFEDRQYCMLVTRMWS